MSKISSGSLTVVDVKGGSDGINTATIYLYQRAKNTPEKPQSNITYTFNTATVSGGLGSWQTDLSQLTGTNPIWVIAAVAHSNGSSDVIDPSEWVGPTKLAQDGTDGEPGEPGAPGTPGLNQATIFIYKRASNVTKPSNSTYTFATGNFTVDGNWEKTIPTATTENRNPCWVCSAVAIGSGSTAELVWSNPSLLVENGSDGLSPIVTQLTNGVKIVDAEGNETFITNGSDGQSYYTYVRYSENANGSNYVTTPTSDTIYVGIYSGLSSTAPSYDDSGWTWSRYVGQKGEDGQPATQYYAFVKYATDDTGANMQDSPAEGYNYVGTYAGTNSTPSASDFQWSKYVGEDGQQGQPGQSAIQYYAFVRYATDSSGTGMTETPTANTVYVGTYTGQLANPTAQDYKWSKYVGTDGNDGDDGVSVTGIKEVYFLTTGAAPAQSTLPNGTEIISTSTASGQWTTAVPTYIVNGKYYISIQTSLDKGTSPIFSNIVLNQGLTDANKNAYDASIDASEAKELSRATQQHFWFNAEDIVDEDGVTVLTESGAYITDTLIDSFKQNKTGGYLLARSDGLVLGKDSNKDAILNSDGLITKSGGIIAGEAGSNGYVYLSTHDYPLKDTSDPNNPINGLTINNHTPTAEGTDDKVANDPAWREVIGTKFGVDSEGNLYAAGAHIDGDIIAQSLTIGSGANAYDGMAAINISGYSIEIVIENIEEDSDHVYLYPHLYHNGIEERVSDYTRFLWYENNNEIAIVGDRTNYGRILASRSNSYRVTYEFDDGEVGSGTPIETIKVEPTEYITNIDDIGIKVHPKQWSTNSNYLQIDGNGVYIKDSNDTGLAEFTASNAQIGKSGTTHFMINTDSLQAFNELGNKYFEVTANGLTWGSNAAATTTQVDDAALTASNYITDLTDSGIRIHPINNENNSVVINSNGMEIFKDGTDAAYSIAKYGETARIGKSGAPHLYVDDDEIDLNAAEGVTAVKIARGADLASEYKQDIIKSEYPYRPSDDVRFKENQYMSVSTPIKVIDNTLTRVDEASSNATVKVWYNSYSQYAYKTTTFDLTADADVTENDIHLIYTASTHHLTGYYLGAPVSGILFWFYNHQYAPNAYSYEETYAGDITHCAVANSATSVKLNGTNITNIGVNIRNSSQARVGYVSFDGSTTKSEALSADESYVVTYNASTHTVSVNKGIVGDISFRASGYSFTAQASFTIDAPAPQMILGSENDPSTYGYLSMFGRGLKAINNYQMVLGQYNTAVASTTYGEEALSIGKGTSTSRSNAMTVYKTGNVTIAGRLTQSSDRRLKEHIAYLNEDADEFIQQLKPAHYIKDDEHHVGFYAQDVDKADKWDCMTGEMNGYMTLGYMELIAPLVTYCQHLEKRINKLQNKMKEDSNGEKSS